MHSFSSRWAEFVTSVQSDMDELNNELHKLKIEYTKLKEEKEKLQNEFDAAQQKISDAHGCIKLILEADALRQHAFDCGDDDSSIYDLCKHVLRKS